MHVTYDNNWTSACKVSYLEVAAGAQAILDQCVVDNAKVGGSHPLRAYDDCGCHLNFKDIS